MVWFPQFKFNRNLVYLNIYLACLFVCLFVSNKRQNGWTDRAQPLCGISRDKTTVMFIDDIIFINLLLTKFDFWKFLNPRILLIKSEKFVVLLYNVYKENNVTIEIYSETLNTSKEFIKCRILHFLTMECCRYLVF